MRTTYDSEQAAKASVDYLNAVLKALQELFASGYGLSKGELDFVKGHASGHIRPQTWEQMPLETKQNIAVLRAKRDKLK